MQLWARVSEEHFHEIILNFWTNSSVGDVVLRYFYLELWQQKAQGEL